MLMITSFSNPRVARAFVDYMATQGIILTIQQHTQTDVWQTKAAGRVNAELARFWKTRATRVIWRQAGNLARPAVACTINVFRFSPPSASAQDRLRCF